MNELHAKSVVVGIDGSQAAINAARWAIDEAINRQLPLRLIYVIPRLGAQIASSRISVWELDRGEMVLRQAECAVREARKPVEVETAVFSGEPEEVLLNESRDAARVCVGTARGGWETEKLLGPTASALATHAHCPVAIIRSNCDGMLTERGVIAVVLNDDPDNDEVVHDAMEEGRRRNAIVRQIDGRLNSWVRRYPDVHVEIVAAGGGVNTHENHSTAIDLAVVGRSDAGKITGLTTPNCHPIVGYPDCSVLVVRD